MKNKQEIKTYLIFLFVTLIVSACFYFNIYSPDTYYIKSIGITEYTKIVFGNIRPIQGIIFKIISNLNLEYMFLYRILLTLSIVILSITMFIFYRKVSSTLNNKDENIKQKKLKNILIIIATLSIFLNRYTADNMLFIENFTMYLALFLATISSVIYKSKIRYKDVITLILLTISILSYQTMIVPFFIFVILFDMLENNDELFFSIKNYKKILKLFLIYIIPFFICLLISKITSNMGYEVLDRYGSKGEYLNILYNLIITIAHLFITYSFYAIVAIAVIYLNRNKNKDLNNQKLKTYILNICTILILPIILNSSFSIINKGILSYRMIFAIGSIPGIISIYTIFNIRDINKKYKILVIAILLLEILLYMYCMSLDARWTIANNNNYNNINEIINEYEKESNIKIEKISLYEDMNVKSNYNKVILHYLNDIETYVIYANGWSTIYSQFNQYSIIKADEETYNMYFVNKDWNNFNREQIIFRDNVMHICMY